MITELICMAGFVLLASGLVWALSRDARRATNLGGTES